MSLGSIFLFALAMLGACLLAGCAKPEPFGRDLWRAVQHVDDARR